MYPNDRCRKISGVIPKKVFYELHKGECDEYNKKVFEYGRVPLTKDALIPSLDQIIRKKRKT